jgi:hypothetical protein
MAKERYLLTLTPGLGARIDEARGDTPRTQWIEQAIEQALSDDTHYRTRTSPSPTRAATARGASEPVAPAESPSPLEAYGRRIDAIDRAYKARKH